MAYFFVKKLTKNHKHYNQKSEKNQIPTKFTSFDQVQKCLLKQTNKQIYVVIQVCNRSIMSKVIKVNKKNKKNITVIKKLNKKRINIH